ncbi:hypothetical protein PU560_02415 [Georgenia sp. 10Sc9-8]|uniref:Uncharacterized protein n=1 Tax=Georgenia halotolerans TaxID=3028317 RepID=A0ABT5TTL3_9MICO|nr:hypothetical protein [Georgenia halotolerans]
MRHDTTEAADHATGPENGLTVLGSADAGVCADGVCVRPEGSQRGTG